VPDVQSSYTVVINPPDADRTFLHCPGANDSFEAEDVPDQVLDEGHLLHFGYPPIMARMYEDGGVQCEALLQRARQRGLTVSLDMARPDPASPAGRVDWRSWMERVLPLVDVFVPSIDEILFMLDRSCFDQLESGGGLATGLDAALLSRVAEELLGMGAAIVLLKLGDYGAYLRTTGKAERLASTGVCGPDQEDWLARELYAPCFKVDVAGTTGAGDCTVAGFLAGLIRRLGPEETIRAAVAVGACSVEAPDAWSGVQPWDRMAARLGAGWEQLDKTPALPGWTPAMPAWRGPTDGGQP
jgi:sugar/nucleoside kinase (ribokinase family)